MAEILTAVAGLALGLVIGWRLRRRAALRDNSRATVNMLAAQWAEHVAEHARVQSASVVLRAPEVQIIGTDGSSRTLNPNGWTRGETLDP